MTDQSIFNQGDGATTTNIQFTPALYVFLGSTPAQIGYRLKELQDQSYGDLPIFQYLWIDTDTRTSPEIENWMKSKNVVKTNIGRYNPRTVLKNLDGYPSIAKWWPKVTHSALSTLAQGAKQRRILGRLSLFALFNQTIDGELSIHDTLEQAAQKVAQISNQQQVKDVRVGNTTYSVDNSRVRVYIVNSMCGGTGSGIVYDVVYLLKNFFQNNAVEAEVLGIQILPSVIERAIGPVDPNQKQKVKANAYGYLQDLEYLTETSNWEVEYPQLDVKVTAPPFDYFYVVDIANKAGQFLDEPLDVYKMMSQALFLLSVTPIYGEHIATLTNTAVFDKFFKGKKPFVNALASATLVYPKERIATYCAHRLINDMIIAIKNNVYDSTESRPMHIKLIEDLGLKPDVLFNTIKNNKFVVNDQVEFIKNAKDPGDALSYISNERSNDDMERADLYKQFSSIRESLAMKISADLQSKTAEMNKAFGPTYTISVLRSFLQGAAKTHSINTYISGINTDKSLQDDIVKYSNALDASVKALGDLSTKFVQTAFKFFLKKEWKDKFNTYKAEAITNMAALNAAMLREKIALEQGLLYTSISEEASTLISTLEDFSKQLEIIDGEVKQKVNSFLHAASTGNLFELSKEVVDASYFKDYYDGKKVLVNSLKVFEDFMDLQVDSSISTLKAFDNSGVYKALIKIATKHFQDILANVTLLDEMKQHYGKDFEQVLTDKIDSVLGYCLPFWRYHKVDESLLTMSPAFIGVEDANSGLIPDKYRNRPDIKLVSTGIKDMISFARTEHGVALWMLVEQHAWRKAYDDYLRKSNRTDPINIIPEASKQSIDPESNEINAEVFALGLAFGYITQRGNFYYFDTGKLYTTKGIQPDPAHKIAQGRTKAASEFATNYEWVNETRELVINEIATMGNIAAMDFLKAYVADLTQKKNRLKVEDSNRKQYELEIDLLEKFITQLS